LGIFLAAGAVCAVLPDVDLIARLFSPEYRELHRSLTHSIFFAVVAGVIVALCLGRHSHGHSSRLVIYLTLATASHGMLDALTTHPQGVAFFSPVSHERFVAAWQPINSRSVEFWFVLVPLVLFTSVALRIRGVRGPWFSREAPLSIRRE
jgi:inner membrane protein